MVSGDAISSPLDNTPAATEGNPSAAAPKDSGHLSLGIGRLLMVAIVAALLGGLASELIGEKILDYYKNDLNPPVQISPNAENVRRWKEARLYSAIFTYGTLGGLMGLTLGMAGGLARRSAFAGVRAAILGAVLGLAAVGPTALVFVSIFYKNHDPQSVDLVVPLLTHGAIWCVAGAVGGLSFGLGSGGGWGRCKAALVGGLGGAAVATVVYELVGAIVFASSKTHLPLSSSGATRAMALLLVAAFSSIGIALSARQPAKQLQ